MLRVVLGVLISILSIVFLAPAALAKDAASQVQKKKKSVKKSIAPQRKSIKKASSKKSRLAVSRKAKSSVRSITKRTKAAMSVRTRRKVLGTRAPAARAMRAANRTSLGQDADSLALRSNTALVIDQSNNQVLYAKNAKVALPIASLTKLMTALVVVEAHQDMDEMLEITNADIDTIKHTGSRLRIGAKLTRANMLHIALMSSENRAASALGRHYPGGMPAFVRAMNATAKKLGMTDTHYVEPTGLSSHNVSSARDLATLVMSAHQHPVIREYSTNSSYAVDTGGPVLQYRNSNRLVSNPDWEIGLQKTGYIAEAGRCLVMQVLIEGRSIIMVFLDSKGKYSRVADAGNIRKWLEEVKLPAIVGGNTEVQG